MQIDPGVLREVEAAGIEFVLEYNRQIAPMQTADIHRDGCTCIRCYRDRLIAALARLRKAMEDGKPQTYDYYECTPMEAKDG